VAAVPPFLAVAAKLRRARVDGKAHHIPTAPWGLPLAVIFTDALPGTKRDRKRLVWAISAFTGFWLIGMATMLLFGPHPR
jgi:hypothetical protein